MGFQAQVNIQPAPASAGDFASANPRASALAGAGQLVAAASGVIVGRFAWANLTNGTVANSGSGAPSGFVHRENNAQIQTWLADSGYQILQGYPVTLMTQGDFWAKINVAAATPGQKAFASLTDGSVQPGAAGATIAGYVETPFFIASAAAIGELAKISTWSAA